MPLQPLSRKAGSIATVRAIFLLALGFCTLIPINLLQLSSLVLLPFSRTSFRAVNRWCANTWWGWCVSAAEHFYGVKVIFTGN